MRLDKSELGSVVVITRINNDGEQRYVVKVDNEYDPDSKDIELISLQEKDAIWGIYSNETIEEVRESLLCDGIRKSWDCIRVVEP